MVHPARALAAALVVTVAFAGLAAEPKPRGGTEKICSGRLIFINRPGQIMRIKTGLLSEKDFRLSAGCSYGLWGVNGGNVSGFRPGQKVVVRFVNSPGCRIADRVEQCPVQYEGTVTAIDLNENRLILHRDGMDRTIQLADGCPVALRSGKIGVLNDLQPGDFVAVTYEVPNGRPIARQISQIDSQFIGKLTAIDLGEQFVKATADSDTVKFDLAADCAISINGRAHGKLSQLQPNQRLLFSYETINGVNIVDRIADVPGEQKNSLSSSAPGRPGNPSGF